MTARTTLRSTNAIFAMADRAAELRAQGIDVITLAAGEPEAPTADHIVHAAIVAAKSAATHHYGTAAGHPELRELIAARMRTTHANDISAADIQIAVGAKHALHLALKAITGPGGEVLTASPGWPGHREAIASVDATPILVDTDDDFLLCPSTLERVRTPRTRALILANPANPTGALHRADVVASVAHWCHDHDIWLICDEIYDAFVYDGRSAPVAAAAPGARQRLITVNGVSKAHAMTGWRIGWLHGPAEVLTRARNYLGATLTHVPLITQLAAVAALSDDAVPTAAVAQYRRNRDKMVSALNRIDGITCALPTGGMFAFPDVSELLGRGTWTDTDNLADWLLNHAHVAVVAGSAFGSDRHLRLNFTGSATRLDVAMHRLATMLNTTSR